MIPCLFGGLSVCLFGSLSGCVSVCLAVCLFVCLIVCRSVCPSVGVCVWRSVCPEVCCLSVCVWRFVSSPVFFVNQTVSRSDLAVCLYVPHGFPRTRPGILLITNAARITDNFSLNLHHGGELSGEAGRLQGRRVGPPACNLSIKCSHYTRQDYPSCGAGDGGGFWASSTWGLSVITRVEDAQIWTMTAKDDE